MRPPVNPMTCLLYTSDTAASKAALPGLRELYRREYSRIPVRFALCAKPEGLELTADDGQGHTARAVSRSQPQPAKTDQRPGIERALGKTCLLYTSCTAPPR